jgi:hypothetical protein
MGTFVLKRVSAAPNSAISVIVQQDHGDGDAGLAAGGHFLFYPAGSQDGPAEYQVGEPVARAVMDDPGLAGHFECSPALGGSPAAPGRARRGAANTQDVPASNNGQ